MNRNMKSIMYVFKTALIVCIFFLIQFANIESAQAQTTELKIIDLDVRSKSNVVLNMKETIQKDVLFISFKTNKPELVERIIVHIGTRQGRKNILNKEYSVINDGGKYYVDVEKERFKIKGYNTYLEIPIDSSERNDILYIKIYAEDKTRQFTKELNYKI